MLKKILLGLFLVIILVFGGLTYYVSTLDWNTYKSKIADKFLEITGKEIDFAGRLNVSLFPEPHIIADNVSVYNQGQNKKPLVTINKLETSVSALSLLRGVPEIDSLSVSDAKVWVEQYENGKFNWSNTGSDTPSEETGQTSLRNLNLQNATFHYENKAADIEFNLENINAEVQASAIDGPYRMDGNFTKDSDHFAIAVGVGSISSLDGIEINFSLSHPATESNLRFDGTYNPQEHNIKGDFSGGSKKTAQVVNILAKTKLLEEKDEKELQFSSGVEVDETAVKLSSFVTKYSNDIEGSGSLNYPLVVAEDQKRQIDLKYEFLNFNLRHFYPLIKTLYEKITTNKDGYAPDTNFNIKADLAAKHVDFSDNDAGFLENVTLKTDWTDNVLTVEEFYASASGDTSISVSGNIREEDLMPHYFLKNSIISADFLSFANALGANLKSYVQSTYRNAELDFSVVGNNNGFSIEGAEFTMDKMKINSDFDVVFSAENPQIKAQIKADSFNFDNYMPDDKEQRTFFQQLSEDAKTFAFLKDYEFVADFSAESAVFRSTPITGLKINIKDQKGLLTINELSAQKIAGATINIAGDIDLNKENFEVKELKTDITTANIADLISQTNFALPSWKIFKTKNFTLSSTTNGALQDFNIQSNISADSADIVYDGSIKNVIEAPEFSGNFGIKTTNTGQLLDGFDFESKNIPNRNGALNCEGQLFYNAEKFDYSQAKCLIGTAEYRGNFSLTEKDGLKNITSKIDSDDFNLAYLFEFNPSKTANFGTENLFDDTFISRPDLSRDIINLDKYKNIVLSVELNAEKATLNRIAFENMHFLLTNKDNAIKIENIDTYYKKAHYTGEITVFYANPEMPEIKGNLKFSDVDVGLLGGNIYMFNNGILSGNTAFESKGASVYDVFANISGYVSMTAENINFKGFDFAAIQRDIAKREYSKGLFQVVRDNLQRGETEFDKFDVTIAMKNGNLTVSNLKLTNPSANSDLSFDVDIKNWKITSTMTISLNGIENIPTFNVSLNGSLQKPSLEINIENIVRQYDEHWKKMEEEARARKEALRRELDKQMQEQQEKLEKLSLILNAYSPEIEAHKAKSKTEENIAWYTNRQAEINLINNDLDAMKSVSHTPDYTADDIAKIKEKIDNYNSLVEPWNTEISNRYKQDVEDRYSKLLTNKSNRDINLQKLTDAYNQKLNEKLAELKKLDLEQKLSENQSLKQQKTAFDGLRGEFADLSSKLDTELLSLNSLSDTNQREEVVTRAENMEEKAKQKYSEVEKSQQNLLEKLSDITSGIIKENSEVSAPSEKIEIISESAEKTKSDEPEKKPDTSLLKDVSETAEMIEKLNSNEQKPQGILIKSYEQNKPAEEVVETKKSGLLKPADGALRKASGTITVK